MFVGGISAVVNAALGQQAAETGRIEICQSRAIGVDASCNEGLCLARTDADDVGVGGQARVADVDVGTAGGEVVARLIAQRDVGIAGGIVVKRLVAVGRVIGTACVEQKRLVPVAGVGTAVRVRIKRRRTIDCVLAAIHVIGHRINTAGDVLTAGRISTQRSIAISRVVAPGCVGIQRGIPHRRVIVAAHRQIARAEPGEETHRAASAHIDKGGAAGINHARAGRCRRQIQVGTEYEAAGRKAPARIAFHHRAGQVRTRGRVAQRHRAVDGAGGDVRVAGDGKHAGVVQRRRAAQRHRAAANQARPGGDGDGIVGQLAVGHRAAELARGQRAQQVAGRVGHYRVGCGREFLARRQRGETRGAVGAHGDVQPARVAVEHACAEVKHDGEQPVGDGRGGVGQRGARHAASRHSVVNRKS